MAVTYTREQVIEFFDKQCGVLGTDLWDDKKECTKEIDKFIPHLLKHKIDVFRIPYKASGGEYLFIWMTREKVEQYFNELVKINPDFIKVFFNQDFTYSYIYTVCDHKKCEFLYHYVSAKTMAKSFGMKL